MDFHAAATCEETPLHKELSVLTLHIKVSLYFAVEYQMW